MSEFYWIRTDTDYWTIGEKRHLNRWFVCGISHIINGVLEVGEPVFRNKNYSGDKKDMQQTIEKLVIKIEEIKEELKKHENALEALQGLCSHYHTVPSGRNEKCVICGKLIIKQ